LDSAQQRNFQKWNIIGVYVWPNYFIGNSYAEEIQNLKTWISGRLNWMDANMPGNCYLQPLFVLDSQNPVDRKLLKVVDLLAREVKNPINQVSIYIYDDGSVERKTFFK
jgi:hypothetical protein